MDGVRAKPPPSDPPGSPPCTDASLSMVGCGVKVRAMEGALASEDVREMSAGTAAGSSTSSLPSVSARGHRVAGAKTEDPKGTKQEKAKSSQHGKRCHETAMKQTYYRGCPRVVSELDAKLVCVRVCVCTCKRAVCHMYLTHMLRRGVYDPHAKPKPLNTDTHTDTHTDTQKHTRLFGAAGSHEAVELSSDIIKLALQQFLPCLGLLHVPCSM